MSEENQIHKGKWQRFRESLSNTYRLVVMNDETFEEVNSTKLSLLNIYVLLSSVLVIMAILVWLMIAFTPLRKYVPGYGDVMQDQEIRELYRQVEELEDELVTHRKYSENFRRILVGEVVTEDDVPKVDPEMMDEAVADTAAELSEEELELRNELTLEEVGVKAQAPRTTNLSPKDTPLERLFFSSPISGEISAGFMPDKEHFGVDVLAPKNTPIKAAMDGYVFLSDWTLETGNTIGIQHSSNLITFYKHNSVLLKEVGSYVKAGEAVAVIGNTGTMSNGPHLHFELWYKGKPIDPTEYIDF
ncbi:M23 family metallopeptidase [Flavilitoribacter nigricans]|uniref:Peptidase M23 n=1 Tax=Flavilitoribacter nigricans (strain ATCC 23147 / DSM 23189 / NBRC 102662 / NCIMB 1420 / SS-2) TaxID=1122177 RepID=A0A2D0N6D7_FLAN2|nr:M23 family metallopeptidase [Flavilitoribacter nigricans]PHN04092.1 peptidase M23 [Flavilitoribacter nigricans DSM 23189 = NBRC 102662]